MTLSKHLDGSKAYVETKYESRQCNQSTCHNLKSDPLQMLLWSMKTSLDQ